MMKTKLVYLTLFVAFVSVVGLWAQDKEDALVQYRNGNYDRAISICSDEIKRMPNNMDSYVVLGWSYLKKGDYQNALDSGLQGLKITRYDARVVEIVGEADYYLGKNLDALKYFEEYSVIAPTGDRIELVYYYMGEIFIRLGEYHHADIAFTTAVYHYPNLARWWARLGYAREMAEDWKYARTAYEKAIQLNNLQKDAIRGLARVKQKLGA
ncbi:MAG: tetratricopeptide repeat protein [Spirochaetales bacterium]|nr:tetratricopeptide repeat protein [Spirochaetales bacterium]